jgi:hypothetical protein
MLYSSVVGHNDVLVSDVASFYLKEGQKVADITWEKGVFWRKIDLTKYDFHRSDLITCPESKYDFRNLPYGDAEFDTVVFDPPYVHNPGRLIVGANYRNAETTRGMYHDDILKLYVDGMKEVLTAYENPTKSKEIG